MKKILMIRFFTFFLTCFLIMGILGASSQAYASTEARSYQIEDTDSGLDMEDYWRYNIDLDHYYLDFSKPGQRQVLRVENLYPAEEELIWSSDDSKVATVSSSGIVTAVGRGVCTIKVCQKKHPEIADYCDVYVENYSVTYHFNNGTAAQIRYYDGYFPVELSNPKRKGYTFVGWYTEQNYIHKIKEIEEENEKNYHLYARWKKTVKPGKASVKLSSTSSGKMKVSIRKKVSGAKGYQVIVSKSKSFKYNNKIVHFSGSSKNLSGLSAGARYFVKVRAYTTDSTGQKVYGNYSVVKSVSVKKASAKKSSVSTGNYGGTVYITRTGAKYHRGGCRYLRQSKIAISKSTARSWGYTPCKVCRP